MTLRPPGSRLSGEKNTFNFKFQFPATGGKGYLTQVPPVISTWYTILDTASLGWKDLCLYGLIIYQSNDEAAAKNERTRVTVDSNVLGGGNDRSLSNNQDNSVYLYPNVGTPNFTGNDHTTTQCLILNKIAPIIGKDVKAEVEITSAAGTNQKLHAVAIFGRLIRL